MARWAYTITRAIARSGEYPDKKDAPRKQQRVGGNDR